MMQAMCKTQWEPIKRMIKDDPSLTVDEALVERWDKFVQGKNLCVDCKYADLTPKDLLASIMEMEQDNYMTKMYSATSVFSFFGDASHFSDDQRVQLAKAAMDRFTFVGTQN